MGMTVDICGYANKPLAERAPLRLYRLSRGADLNGLAPFLVSFDPLGTIYEGVSFFITGGNVVAVVFMHGIVFR